MLERQINVDCAAYLDWVTSLNVAAAFWTRNVNFKNAASNYKKIRDLLRDAMKACETEFERLLSTHARPVDLARTGTCDFFYSLA